MKNINKNMNICLHYLKYCAIIKKVQMFDIEVLYIYFLLTSKLTKQQPIKEELICQTEK